MAKFYSTVRPTLETWPNTLLEIFYADFKGTNHAKSDLKGVEVGLVHVNLAEPVAKVSQCIMDHSRLSAGVRFL